MSEPSVVVIDYESGNLRSVCKALEKAGVQPILSSDPTKVADADAVVLPGVGAGDAAMRALHRRNLVKPLRAFAESGKPLLAVCLGLQLLMDDTEEGDAPCLSIVPGTTKRLPNDVKVPHMGWNKVVFKGKHPLFLDIPDESYFYFVHSYYAQPMNGDLAVGVTEYGTPFCSSLVHGNVMATQFHPEKSGQLGLKIYHNFVMYARKAAGVYHPTGASQ